MTPLTLWDIRSRWKARGAEGEDEAKLAVVNVAWRVVNAKQRGRGGTARKDATIEAVAATGVATVSILALQLGVLPALRGGGTFLALAVLATAWWVSGTVRNVLGYVAAGEAGAFWRNELPQAAKVEEYGLVNSDDDDDDEENLVGEGGPEAGADVEGGHLLFHALTTAIGTCMKSSILSPFADSVWKWVATRQPPSLSSFGGLGIGAIRAEQELYPFLSPLARRYNSLGLTLAPLYRLSLRRSSSRAWDLVNATGVVRLLERDARARSYADDLARMAVGAVATVVTAFALFGGTFDCTVSREEEEGQCPSSFKVFLTLVLSYVLPLMVLQIKSARLAEAVAALYLGYAEDPTVLSQVDATLSHRFSRVLEEAMAV